MTATELNAGVLALRVSDQDRERLSPTLVGSYNNTTVGERSRVRALPPQQCMLCTTSAFDV